MRDVAAGAVLGGGLAALVFVLIVSLLSVQARQQHHASSADQAEQTLERRVPSATREQIACARASEPSESEAEQREKDDLCAQFRSAAAAERMLAFSVGQNWINYFEAGALAFSLIFTGWAAREAARAAKAAEAAVEQGEETAKIELRAYLYTEGAGLFDLNDLRGPGIGVAVKNSGHTPAHDVSFSGGYAFLPADVESVSFSELFGPDWDEASEVATIAPGDERYITWRIPRDELEQHREAVESERELLVVLGSWLYFDVFGEIHELRISRYVSVESGEIVDGGPMNQWGESEDAD